MLPPFIRKMKTLFETGVVVTVDFAGVTGGKRRPAVVLSSSTYHVSRPDVIVGLITSQTAAAVGLTDCFLSDWAAAGLRVPSAFRSFVATLPPAANFVKIGQLSDTDWQAVCDRIKISLGSLEREQHRSSADIQIGHEVNTHIRRSCILNSPIL